MTNPVLAVMMEMAMAPTKLPAVLLKDMKYCDGNPGKNDHDEDYNWLGAWAL